MPTDSNLTFSSLFVKKTEILDIIYAFYGLPGSLRISIGHLFFSVGAAKSNIVTNGKGQAGYYYSSW